MRYYLSKKKEFSEEHEIHTASCIFLPKPENRIDLGEHETCPQALRVAKTYFKHINGCFFCSGPCHVRQIAELQGSVASNETEKEDLHISERRSIDHREKRKVWEEHAQQDQKTVRQTTPSLCNDSRIQHLYRYPCHRN